MQTSLEISTIGGHSERYSTTAETVALLDRARSTTDMCGNTHPSAIVPAHLSFGNGRVADDDRLRVRAAGQRLQVHYPDPAGVNQAV